MLEPTENTTLDPLTAGRTEADAFDRRLRDIEAKERHRHLSGVSSPEGRRPSTEYQPTLDVGRLKARMEELVAFRSAVQESFVWRAAQVARRLFGRAW
jgi:hypothetical protein